MKNNLHLIDLTMMSDSVVVDSMVVDAKVVDSFVGSMFDWEVVFSGVHFSYFRVFSWFIIIYIIKK